MSKSAVHSNCSKRKNRAEAARSFLEKSDLLVVVFSVIKCCQNPQFTQIVQKEKTGGHMRGTIHRWRIGARMSQLPFLSESRAQSDAQKLTLLAFSDSIGVLSINSERIPHSAHSGMD